VPTARLVTGTKS